MICKLITFFTVFVIAFGLSGTVRPQSVPEKTVSSPTAKISDDGWELDDSSGIPVWIARQTKYYGEMRIVLYIEQQYFNRNDLGKVFASLSNRYKDSMAVWAEAYSNKDIVRDDIAASKSGLYYSWRELPDSMSLFKKAGASRMANKFSWSLYQRTQDEEKYHISGPNERVYEEIVIRAKPKKKPQKQSSKKPPAKAMRKY